MDDSDETSIKITEILVALDYSRYSRAALETAAAIAKLMEARIHGLFVHDDEWLRISKLPSLTEIDELTGRISPIGRESVEREIRYLEKTIKEHFELVSRQHQLPSAWSSVKGTVTEKVLEASEESDIITIGIKGRSHGRGKLGRTAAAIIRSAGKPVLILQKRLNPGHPQVAVFDGSKRSATGVKIAADIAEKNNTRLIILNLSEAFPPDDSDTSNSEMPEISGVNEVKELKLDQPNMGRFLFMLNRLQGGLLVLPQNIRFTKRNTLERILESADCPVLLAG